MESSLRLTDPLLPPPPGGLGRGALLALTVHGGLIVALTMSVQWRAQPVPVVAAELWTALPQQAAPAPAPEVVAPPPPPAPAPTPPRAAEPEPDIALERQRKEREQQREAERERERDRDRERQARLDADKRERAEKAQREERERKAAETRLAQQREENLKRMLGQAGGTGTGGTGTAPRDGAPSLAYGSRLIAHIKPNIVFTESISGNPTAEVEVRAGPSGTIIARRLLKSSGVKEWDEAVLRAIDRTGALPRDSDGRVPPLLIIGFRPND